VGGDGLTISDAFVTKFNPAGSSLVYSTYLGGSGNDFGHDIAIDAAGNVYVTGDTRSSNFPTIAALQPIGHAVEAFVTKLNPAGSDFVYSTYLGGGGDDEGRGIDVDAAGNAYVTGFTGLVRFPSPFPTRNPLQSFGGGISDAFVTKLNPSGSDFVYSTYLGGSGNENDEFGFTDFSGNIAVDAAGSAYVIGTTSSTDFPTRNPFQSASGGGRDAFMTKMFVDVNPPTITCPANVTIPCGAPRDPGVLGSATATDDFDPSPTISFSDVFIPGACANTILRTWTAADDDGNTSACTQIITEVDCNLPACNVTITSPQDSAIICDDSITVKATFTITGGVPAFVTNGDINGHTAIVFGNTFMATVPLAPGWNNLVATCTVSDGCGNRTVCRDVIRVFSIIDTTPPRCDFTFRGISTVTGSFVDEESGIAEIVPLLLYNATLIVYPFMRGANSVNFRLESLGLDEYIGFDIKIIDRCGNTHICDPVMAYLAADRDNPRYDFKFRSVDRYLMLTNHGLSEIRIELNGHSFNLYSASHGGARTLNAYRLPEEGDLTIDLQPYLREGENRMRVTIAGRAGADFLLIDEVHVIDHTLELQPIPEEFQLSQNYPNPFNPATTIRFSIPARIAAGVPVQLRIYSLLGELVRTLVDERMFPGLYAVEWDGRDLHGTAVASGIYIYQFVTGEFKQTKRMIVLR